MALKTGREHWMLAREERALMSEAAGAIPAKYGVALTPQENPVVCLLLGYIGFGVPRIIEELRLIREELKAKREKEEAEKRAKGAEAAA
jgi:hypothetical protein